MPAEPPLILGDGMQTMDFVYVEDVARANLLALTSDVSDDVFNVGTGVETSLNQLAARAVARHGRAAVAPRVRAGAEGQRRARGGWPRPRRRGACSATSASVTLEEGLSRLVAWWRAGARPRVSRLRPTIPVARPWLDEREAEAARRAILSGWVTQGPEVAAFEREFAAAVGASHACAVSSCTTALHLALVALGVGPGDEVVTVSHSFIATANAVRYCGARARVRGRGAGHAQHRTPAASRPRAPTARRRFWSCISWGCPAIWRPCCR